MKISWDRQGTDMVLPGDPSLVSHAASWALPFWCYCANLAADPRQACLVFLHRGSLCQKSGGAVAMKGSVACKQAAVGVTKRMGTSCVRVCHLSGGGGRWHTWWVSLSHHLTSSNFIPSQPLGHLQMSLRFLLLSPLILFHWPFKDILWAGLLCSGVGWMLQDVNPLHTEEQWGWKPQCLLLKRNMFFIK